MPLFYVQAKLSCDTGFMDVIKIAAPHAIPRMKK
ncbi:hypothetical protein AusDCA_2732 [Desulfitobacterium sp. AusDCA]